MKQLRHYIIRKWRKSSIPSEDFDVFVSKITSIIDQHEKIVLCPENTGVNWLGVKNATSAMFPGICAYLPQSYSNTLLNKKQVEKLISILNKSNCKHVIFSGQPYYIFDWIKKLDFKRITIGAIYHGGLAELSNDKQKQQQVKCLLKLTNTNIISKLGVVKVGVDKWFSKVSKANVFKVYPVLKTSYKIDSDKFNDGKIHIGIFGNSSFNKNRHTQVVAASLIENSVIHILEPNEFDYSLPENRIVTHTLQSHDNFLKLLSKMDFNLYCSYSESWGQVVLESLAVKTPCFFSKNSGLEKYIGDELLIIDYDNPYAIADKILSFDIEKFSFPEVNSLNDDFSKKNSTFLNSN